VSSADFMSNMLSAIRSNGCLYNPDDMQIKRRGLFYCLADEDFWRCIRISLLLCFFFVIFLCFVYNNAIMMFVISTRSTKEWVIYSRTDLKVK